MCSMCCPLCWIVNATLFSHSSYTDSNTAGEIIAQASSIRSLRSQVLVSSQHRQLPSDDPKDKSLRGSDRETLGAIQLDQSTFQGTVHLGMLGPDTIMWWCTILLEKLRERANFSA
ncbi:hypothetical protein ILYODFUR_039206 [Ilyodon furcidens]|uniref:Uncharacterized protein n=1 Tax=Ilyodon furcidens TaxID=33524 RepID=A0ABV0UG27_9TELE